MKYLGNTQSGSMGGTTASRNRNGQYLRRRATPVNPRSAPQLAVRARLSSNAATWRTLTDNQRAGWKDLGQQMTRNDSLGQAHTLTGFQAYCSVNQNRLTAGDAVLADAPDVVTPALPATVTVTLTNAAFSVAYTATPLAAGVRLFIYCSGQLSAGRNFNKNVKLITVTAAAAASPSNILAAYSAKYGVPVTGGKVFIVIRTYQGGFLSGAFLLAQVIA